MNNGGFLKSKTPVKKEKQDRPFLGKKSAYRRLYTRFLFVLPLSLLAVFLHGQQTIRVSDEPVVNSMVRITGGTFMMGSPANEPGRLNNEGPQRQVTVSSFYIGRFPVTQREFEEVMGVNPSTFRGANLPVERVSWFDAVEFANRMSIRAGLTPAYTIRGNSVTWNREANGYRLPTEAEWEFACRAGTQTPFNAGNSASDVGWHVGNSGGRTHPVGQKLPNNWGLYDMHGNVLEWCWDWYGAFTTEPQVNPQGPSWGVGRVYRGGSWRFEPHQTRSAFRFRNNPALRINFVGFRLARNAEEQPLTAAVDAYTAAPQIR
ncbi:MAG: formylglycine-generating enzyme family protein [Treponema sp.]|jgi:formylglycine-generating enzyme required for sulfatase activity|nr:formylglycine-generating enzyme family protein [Treponema sp.]